VVSLLDHGSLWRNCVELFHKKRQRQWTCNTFLKVINSKQGNTSGLVRHLQSTRSAYIELMDQTKYKRPADTREFTSEISTKRSKLQQICK
jgi:hypothetical protein